MSEHILTIILPTFNRKDLVKRAHESCCRQTCKDFDLIIVDNCSTDGTREYLLAHQNDLNMTRLILNSSNLGPRDSHLKAFRVVSTEWVTILCDDDYLDDRFVECSLETLKSTDKDFVTVGFNYVDEKGHIFYTFRPERRAWGREEGLWAFLDGKIRTAGASGFFYRPRAIEPEALSRIYPQGFLCDTMMCVQTIIPNGLEALDQALYNKLIWDQCESGFSMDNIKLYFEAMLIFGRDVIEMLEKNGFSPHFLSLMRRPISLRRFCYILILPILGRGYISLRDIDDMFAIARRYDRRYLTHCAWFAASCIIANKATWTVRKRLHRLYRRLVGRQPAD